MANYYRETEGGRVMLTERESKVLLGALIAFLFVALVILNGCLPWPPPEPPAPDPQPTPVCHPGEVCDPTPTTQSPPTTVPTPEPQPTPVCHPGETCGCWHRPPREEWQKLPDCATPTPTPTPGPTVAPTPEPCEPGEVTSCAAAGHQGTYPSLAAACDAVLSHDEAKGHMTCQANGWCTDGRGYYRRPDCDRYDSPGGRLLSGPKWLGIECETTVTECPEPLPPPDPPEPPAEPTPTPGPTPTVCPQARASIAPCCHPQGVRLRAESATQWKLAFGMNQRFGDANGNLCNDEHKGPNGELAYELNCDGRWCESLDEGSNAFTVTWTSGGNISGLRQSNNAFWLWGEADKRSGDTFWIQVCSGNNVDRYGVPIPLNPRCTRREYKLSKIEGIGR